MSETPQERIIENLRGTVAAMEREASEYRIGVDALHSRIKVLEAERDTLRLKLEQARSDRDEAISELAARLEAVLALHVPARIGGRPRCVECQRPWPCPTRRALEGKP
jgi:chromosome segregation ATPase